LFRKGNTGETRGHGLNILLGQQKVIHMQSAGMSGLIEFYQQCIDDIRRWRHSYPLPDTTHLTGYRKNLGQGDFLYFLGIEVAKTFALNEEAQWRAHDRNTWSFMEAGITSLADEPGKSAASQWQLVAWSVFSTLRDHDAMDRVVLRPWDKGWVMRFQSMNRKIREEYPWQSKPGNLRIEHYGSTAVPGLCAKPVVDLLVEDPEPERGGKGFLELFLHSPEWEYWYYTDHHLFVGRRQPFGEREFHVHVAEKENRVWKGLRFREILRNNPETAQNYARLKSSLSMRFPHDRERYTMEKTEFIRSVLGSLAPA
jgi:GrpB-like predicted nucleotidyltransferase (UPF0157 family)